MPKKNSHYLNFERKDEADNISIFIAQWLIISTITNDTYVVWKKSFQSFHFHSSALASSLLLPQSQFHPKQFFKPNHKTERQKTGKNLVRRQGTITPEGIKRNKKLGILTKIRKYKGKNIYIYIKKRTQEKKTESHGWYYTGDLEGKKGRETPASVERRSRYPPRVGELIYTEHRCVFAAILINDRGGKIQPPLSPLNPDPHVHRERRRTAARGNTPFLSTFKPEEFE